MKKLTKRERKKLNGPNHAAQQTLESRYSQLIQMSDRSYMGLSPSFKKLKNGSWVKTDRGIPYVRLANSGM